MNEQPKSALDKSRDWVMRQEATRVERVLDFDGPIYTALQAGRGEPGQVRSPLDDEDLDLSWEMLRRGVVVPLQDDDLELFVVLTQDGEPVHPNAVDRQREIGAEARAIGPCRRCGRRSVLVPALRERGDVFRAVRMGEPWEHDCIGRGSLSHQNGTSSSHE